VNFGVTIAQCGQAEGFVGFGVFFVSDANGRKKAPFELGRVAGQCGSADGSDIAFGLVHRDRPLECDRFPAGISTHRSKLVESREI